MLLRKSCNSSHFLIVYNLNTVKYSDIQFTVGSVLTNVYIRVTHTPKQSISIIPESSLMSLSRTLDPISTAIN